ncbi:Methyltransferase type 11 [Caldicellulosiruptor saccharolyticus DSM 8903]|uniref:Methyltransferase type 11 n=1 Tax=Caldicellulosiruptor saccharolyticus (strain ATCC 43494 / DSM 8903 / Tp8T 6331) TaxID=351627 RepID=A4XMC3_CALS8|nr:class I SAM-dependent methyltransferase [Caldicellulosiruptor saccharolyticus]ABP68058.1 Methyltransferase type 11 [Caldicellulosiruptor saccharolyticus DSM 8903]
MDVQRYFDMLAEKWDEIAWHDPQKVNEIIEKIQLKKGDKVLDVGCGTGVLIEYILKFVGQQGSYLGVDISKKMIERAEEKYKDIENVDFVCCDVVDLSFKEYFDAIICYSVFPHIEDKEMAVKKFSQMLKEGGKLAIAHSQSRDRINSLHKDLPEPVKNHFLPPMNEIIDMCQKAELNIICNIDSSEMFLLIAQKEHINNI